MRGDLVHAPAGRGKNTDTAMTMQRQPFASADAAWLWATSRAAAGDTGKRDLVLRAVDRLYRQRRLMRDHLRVLETAGRRGASPPDRPRDHWAFVLWGEAMELLAQALRHYGLVA